jgi:hypothetical protein
MRRSLNALAMPLHDVTPSRCNSRRIVRVIAGTRSLCLAASSETRPAISGRPHTNALPARFATDFCTKYISVSEISEVATTM